MNDKHYGKGAPGGKGGQFAPKNEAGVSSGSISYVPETTSQGNPRRYYDDLSIEEKVEMQKNYIMNHLDFFEENDYRYDNFKTSKIDTPERNFLREMMLNDEFEDQLKSGNKKQEKRATLLLGLPGSGKSTIANPLMKSMGAFIVDADEFKKRIPEFQKDPYMVSAVHHESVNLADKFMNDLSDDGYNMIIGKVGGDYESVGYILDNLSNKGYKIDVILNDLPLDVALNRAIDRYESGRSNRLIPFWTFKKADKHVFDTFDKVLEHPAVIGGKIYSNDVEEGQEPILLHDFVK